MAVINKEIAYMALPLSIRRGNPFPIDEYSVWYDKTEMETYAQENPVAYVGQILALVNEESSTVEAYMIQNVAGSLIKLASTTASGDLTQDVQELQGKVSSIEVDIAALETAIGSKDDESGITAIDLWSAIKEVRDAYIAADAQINSQIDSKIATAISSTYKAAGSINFDDLPELSASEEGKVYNILDEFVTTSDFIEGEGSSYPIGTNIVCVEISDSVFKWDVLAGFVDLSDYTKTSELNSLLDNKVDKVSGSSLVSDTLIDKLTNILEIKSVNQEELEITEDKVLQVVSIPQEKIENLPATLASKVDVEEGKSLVSDTLIDKLSQLAEIKTVSDELSLSDGTLSINSIPQEKVEGLNDVLVAKLTGVTAVDTPLEVLDGVVTIPVAKSDTYGIVKSSEVENGITVSDDGTMSVNNVNVNKLVQTDGEELVLNGGNASVNE